MTDPQDSASSATGEPRPSEIRDRILRDHAVIRTQLQELRELIARVRRGDREAGQGIAGHARSFLEFFLAHTALENRVLVPALRAVDAWGDVRAERVLQEHEEQTAEVRSLIEAFDDPFSGTRELADRLEAFIAALEIDMSAEESASLAPDLLRDDVVGIDVEAG